MLYVSDGGCVVAVLLLYVSDGACVVAVLLMLHVSDVVVLLLCYRC